VLLIIWVGEPVQSSKPSKDVVRRSRPDAGGAFVRAIMTLRRYEYGMKELPRLAQINYHRQVRFAIALEMVTSICSQGSMQHHRGAASRGNRNRPPSLGEWVARDLDEPHFGDALLPTAVEVIQQRRGPFIFGAASCFLAASPKWVKTRPHSR
jgi:hypothetical protein